MDPIIPSSNGAGSPADPTPANTNPDPAAAQANGGVTPPEADPLTPPGDPGKKEPDPIPYGRFKETVDERNTLRTQVETLNQQVTYLTEAVAKQQSGASVTPKERDTAQDALDALITDGQITKSEANKLQRIVDAMGYKRGDAPDPSASKVTELEKRVEFLTNQLTSEADAKQKVSALKKYEGIVSEDELNEEMKKMGNSKDPELRELAKSASYNTIIRVRFHDKIVQTEVDRALKTKPSNAPKIEPGKSAPARTPEKQEIKFDPSNPAAYDRALKEEIRAKLREKAE